MSIEPVTLSDLPSIETLQPDGWSSITPAYKFYIQTDFCFPIKYVLNGAIAGIGATIVHGETAWLGHIIVSPEFRNKGIGTVITQALVDSLQHSTASTILLLATALGEPVYRKIGFIKESEYQFFKGSAIASAETVIPATKNHYEQILSLDARISGEKRNLLLTAHLSEAKIVMENNRVTGFYLPTLVDGPVFAETPHAGRQLLAYRFASGQDKTALPEENKDGIAFLTEHNLVLAGTGSRMYLGKKLAWQPQKVYGRIGGNVG